MSTLFRRDRHVVGMDRSVEWVRTRCRHPVGLICIPPLIGGNLYQQIHTFRWLIRKGYDLISFNFSGHGKSSNGFSISASLHDTWHVLKHSLSLARRDQLPLFGIASCYSAIPLLNATHRLSQTVERIILVNAIPGIHPQPIVASFVSHYLKILYKQKGFTRLRDALRHYADTLFPGITKGRDHFGVLKRHRADLFKIVTECLTLDPLAGVCLTQTPVLCLHARSDSILNIYDARLDYRNRIRRLCPQARFQCLEGNHFLSRPDARQRAAGLITSFLSEAN